jgi:ABC-type Zn2+ transport system substrate-binding protein/surface adhesin
MAAEVSSETMTSHDSDLPGHEGAVSHHETTDHGDDHGHDDHAHDEEPLGPIDVAAWGAGVLGVLAGILIAACFAMATSAA